MPSDDGSGPERSEVSGPEGVAPGEELPPGDLVERRRGVEVGGQVGAPQWPRHQRARLGHPEQVHCPPRSLVRRRVRRRLAAAAARAGTGTGAGTGAGPGAGLRVATRLCLPRGRGRGQGRVEEFVGLGPTTAAAVLGGLQKAPPERARGGRGERERWGKASGQGIRAKPLMVPNASPPLGLMRQELPLGLDLSAPTSKAAECSARQAAAQSRRCAAVWSPPSRRRPTQEASQDPSVPLGPTDPGASGRRPMARGRGSRLATWGEGEKRRSK